MPRSILTASALALLVLPAGLLRADDAKGDKDLDGQWEIKSMLRGGKEPPEDAPKPELTVKGDVLTVKIGDRTFQATVQADPTKTPKTIDMTLSEGPHKGETVKGIYEVKGDELRVCHGEPGADRPTEFASKGEGEVLGVWKRVKK